MSGDSKDHEEIVRRIADGEDVDLKKLEADDATLARGLRKLAMLARSMNATAAGGRRWGHLQQLELAAHGGFGEVYRAYDPTLDRVVALKLKRSDAVDAFSSGRDFVAEARRLARVRHPHVLAVHGASYHDGRAGLWADWIDGETLSSRVQRTGTLRGAELLRVLLELAQAIDAVHRAGLVHGDIKASNVMLDPQGRTTLMDFGAGFESSDQGSAMTSGTPRYLAPEVGLGKPATAAVDIYAFGILMHYLASGDYPSSSRIAASLRPRGLRRLLARLLNDNPQSRPRSEELTRSLQALIDAPRLRARRWLQVSVAAGLTGIATATTIGLYRENQQRHLAETTATFLTELLAAPAPEAQGREIKVAELLNQAAVRANTQPDLSPPQRASLLLTIGRSQLALMRIRDADETLSQAQTLDTQTPPLAMADALQIGLRLAEARSRRQHYPEADAVLQDLERDARWRTDVAAKARIAIERAGWWYFQGKYDQAQAALAPVLDAQSAVNQETRLDALITQSQIAFEQRELQQTETAANQALAMLAASGERFGRREYELRMTLGNALTEQGRYDEGESVYRALAAQAAKTYGDSSASVIGTWGNVAIALNDQSRFHDAELLMREWIPKAEALDGKESAMALGLRSSLAAALYQSGQVEAALAEFDTLVAMDERVFGAEHTQTLVNRFNRVEALNQVHRYAQALADGAALRLTMVKALGEEHPFTWETDDAIGYALSELGRGKEAETLHRQTLEKKTALMGADNPYTLTSREYLARALIAQQRHAEARVELTALAADRERVLGAQHAKTVATRQLLDALP